MESDGVWMGGNIVSQLKEARRRGEGRGEGGSGGELFFFLSLLFERSRYLILCIC